MYLSYIQNVYLCSGPARQGLGVAANWRVYLHTTAGRALINSGSYSSTVQVGAGDLGHQQLRTRAAYHYPVCISDGIVTTKVETEAMTCMPLASCSAIGMVHIR